MKKSQKLQLEIKWFWTKEIEISENEIAGRRVFTKIPAEFLKML